MRKWSAILTILILAALLVPAVIAQDPAQNALGADQPRLRGYPVELSLAPPVEGSTPAGGWVPEAPVTLILDDGTAENNIGVGSNGIAIQFIWLNRFTPDPADFPFELQQISVAFCHSDVPVGGAVDLVVYEDTDGDGDPSNAAWLATFNETVQYNDCTFSVYDLATPVLLNGPGDVLIGVVNRYVVSGVTPQEHPAALDQGASQGRSWAGWYLTDPPEPPLLPPDDVWGIIDDFGLPGNWLIRGAGETLAQVPNDECSNAKVIDTLPYNDIMDTTEATTAPDDPETTCGSGANPQQSNSVWYSFTAPEDGFVYVETCGSGYDTVLAMFEGPCGEPWTEIACNDDSCGLQSELVDIPVVGGETYLIEVTDYGSPGGGQLDFYFDFTPSMQEPMFAKVKLVGKMQGGTYVVGAVVRVVTEPGSPVEQAGVSVFLKKPNGNTRTQTRYTNQYGRVLFPMASPEGGYWLACIEDVQHESYVWDDSGPKCDFLEFPAP